MSRFGRARSTPALTPCAARLAGACAGGTSPCPGDCGHLVRCARTTDGILPIMALHTGSSEPTHQSHANPLSLAANPVVGAEVQLPEVRLADDPVPADV